MVNIRGGMRNGRYRPCSIYETPCADHEEAYRYSGFQDIDLAGSEAMPDHKEMIKVVFLRDRFTNWMGVKNTYKPGI